MPSAMLSNSLAARERRSSERRVSRRTFVVRLPLLDTLTCGASAACIHGTFRSYNRGLSYGCLRALIATPTLP